MTKLGDAVRAALRPRWGPDMIEPRLPGLQPDASLISRDESARPETPTRPAPGLPNEAPSLPELPPENASSTPKGARAPAARSPRRRKPSSAPSFDPGQPDLQLARHEAHCQICRHPQRAAIEIEYLDWVSAADIVEEFQLGSLRAIDRHARATGLLQHRRDRYASVLDWMIERVPLGEVRITATSVVAAVRLKAAFEQRQAESAPPPPRHWVGPNRIQGPDFILSLEGLPRTNAVTGRPPDDDGPSDPAAPPQPPPLAGRK